jgi:Domain of unknown function (DUF4124)
MKQLRQHRRQRKGQHMCARYSSLPTANSRVSAIALFLALPVIAAVAPTAAMAQQMFKWTDEQGQVHYSDRAPPGQTNSSVALPMAPKVSKPLTTNSASPPPAADNSPRNEYGRTPQEAAQDAAEGAAMVQREEAERERIRENELRDKKMWAQMRSIKDAANKAADQAVIDRCKADREVYCGGGADKIRQEQNNQAAQQWNAAVNQHDYLQNKGISTPYPRQPTYGPTRSKVCDKGNKNCRYEWTR